MNTPSAPATPRLPALLTGLLFAGAIVLAAFLLDALARAQLRAHLVDSAVRTLAALERGDTPARWNLAVAADVVGGRAFDAAASRIDDAGLHARSSGQAFEIGLVLPAPIDLERLSILHVAIEAQATGTLALSLRDTLDGPLCANAPLALATGVQTLRIDLDAPGWQCAGDAAGPPSRAAMLRLRIGLPAEANVRVMDVRLDPRNAFDRQSLQAVALDPPIDAAATAALERIAPTHWPLVEIGLRARVERTRLAIDRIRAVAPAAIILPRGELGAVIASARTEASAVAPAPRAGTFPAWALVAALASALAWVRWHSWSSPRWQAAAELAAVAGVPLVILAGGAVGDDFTAPPLVALGLSVAFAASLLKGGAPRQPTTRTWLRGALVALACVAVTLTLVALLRDPMQAGSMPPATRVLRYLGWAALQQFLVTVVIAGCIERITGSPRMAIVLGSFLFALLHAPNAMLMQFTFLGGLVWIWNWQQHRALLANTLAHAACGLLIATGLPPEWLRSAEIGARYFLF